MIELQAETIRLARQGDEDASRTIIRELHRPVLATIYRFLGPRFRPEYEDIAQDIFLKLFRSIERFDFSRNVKFTTWTFTFVRNHCFDILKKRRIRTTSMGVGDPDERAWDFEDESASVPQATAENTELGKKIEEAVATLGEEQRMVFVLREYEGLDYRAIAEVMSVSEGTIKSRLHRAKESLRERLAPYLRTGT